MIQKLILHYRANKQIVLMGATFVVCCLLHNFPVLIGFLPEGPRQLIQATISTVINGGVGFLAFFFTKQFNTSGKGTLADPYTKPSSSGGSKTINP